MNISCLNQNQKGIFLYCLNQCHNFFSYLHSNQKGINLYCLNWIKKCIHYYCLNQNQKGISLYCLHQNQKGIYLYCLNFNQKCIYLSCLHQNQNGIYSTCFHSSIKRIFILFTLKKYVYRCPVYTSVKRVDMGPVYYRTFKYPHSTYLFGRSQLVLNCRQGNIKSIVQYILLTCRCFSFISLLTLSGMKLYVLTFQISTYIL